MTKIKILRGQRVAKLARCNRHGRAAVVAAASDGRGMEPGTKRPRSAPFPILSPILSHIGKLLAMRVGRQVAGGQYLNTVQREMLAIGGIAGRQVPARRLATCDRRRAWV